jgi:hypothetical protein
MQTVVDGVKVTSHWWGWKGRGRDRGQSAFANVVAANQCLGGASLSLPRHQERPKHTAQSSPTSPLILSHLRKSLSGRTEQEYMFGWEKELMILELLTMGSLHTVSTSGTPTRHVPLIHGQYFFVLAVFRRR